MTPFNTGYVDIKKHCKHASNWSTLRPTYLYHCKLRWASLACAKKFDINETFIIIGDKISVVKFS